MPDGVSRVLTDLKSDVQPNGSLRQAPQHGLKGLLRAVPHVFRMVVRVDTAEFIGSDKRAIGHHADAVQNVPDPQLLAQRRVVQVAFGLSRRRCTE